MRIKKRLQINIAISFLTALVICLVLVISLYRLNKSNKSENVADDIMTGAFERVAFKNDYIRNNSDRAKEQWYAKHEQVGKALKSAIENFRGAEERKSVAGLIEVHEAIGRIFSAIVANRDRNSLNPGSTALSREVEERLLNQLDMRVYEVAILSRQLLQLSTEERDSALRIAGGGVFLTLLILVASATLNSWVMSRTITARVLRLREGAEVIGEGNLDHKIDVTGDDEFAELSEELNAMTTKLRVSYSELENEIGERKRAEMEREELLRTIEEKSGQLEAILANMAEAVGIWSADGALVLVNDATVKLYGFETKGQMLKHLSEYADIKVWTLDGRELPQEEWPPSRALRGETFSNWWLKQEVPSRGLRFVGSNSGAPVRDANGKIVLAVITLHNVTELYESQEAVKQSQKTFAELIERSPFGTYVVDSQFRIAMMNASSQEGAFRNVRPIIGRPFDEAMRILWPEPVALEIIGNFRHTLDTGEPYYSRDFIKPRHDTEIVESYEWELHRMTLPDGQQGVICYYYDSTKLRQAEAALTAAHRQTQSLIDNTTAMVYACDLEERFVLANVALAALLRTAPAQLLGKRRHEFMPQADANAHEAADREVIAAGRAVEFEEHSDLHGRSITWLSTKFPLRDAQGRIYGVAGIVTDISERKRAEEALRESEQRLRLALDAAQAAAWETNLATGQNAWDERLARLLGVPAEEAAAAQQRWLEFVHPDDRARVAAAFAGASEHGGPPYDVEFRVRCADGTERWFLSMGMRVVALDGTARMLGVIQDITARKQAQESLKASLAEKEVLLKEIHHRVKNNMQVISSLVALQANQLQDAGMRAILDEMAQRVRSMAMIHEKLYQSHNLAGVEFSDYARSLLNYLWRSHASAASTIRLTLDLEPVSLTVNTAVPCGLILNELVSNALKHAFRGRNGGEVTVSLLSAKGGIRLSVRDDGSGLPAGLDWKQTKSLGLRLVQMLAGQLHAEVELDCEGGTEFRITFRQAEPAKDLR